MWLSNPNITDLLIAFGTAVQLTLALGTVKYGQHSTAFDIIGYVAHFDVYYGSASTTLFSFGIKWLDTLGYDQLAGSVVGHTIGPGLAAVVSYVYCYSICDKFLHYSVNLKRWTKLGSLQLNICWLSSLT
jgi:hypothetical protein